MWNRGFTALALVLVGCGARTTLDQTDYLDAVAGSGNGGSTNGGSTAGGQGGVAGEAGRPMGGTTSAGTTAGGMAGIAGMGGSVGGAAGAGGQAGGMGRGLIKQSCESFCVPYATACPADIGTVSDCTWQCMADFGEGPTSCRQMTIDALNCMSVYFDPGLGCDQALLTAYDACFELVTVAQDCNETGGPTPTPTPVCPGSFYSSDLDCTSTLMCQDASYYVSCYLIQGNQSACDCNDDFGGSTSFVSQVPISYACDYAMELCGYPY